MDKNIGCIYTRLVYSFSYLYNHHYISITENHNPFGMPPLTLSPTAHSAARDSCWAYMWLAGCSIFSRRQLASNSPLSRPCLSVSSLSVCQCPRLCSPLPSARNHWSFFFVRRRAPLPFLLQLLLSRWLQLCCLFIHAALHCRAGCSFIFPAD